MMFCVATHILVIFMCAGISYEEQYPLWKLKAIQSRTINGHDAKFGIDGDVFSYSTSLGSNDSFPEFWKNVPWWEADLQYLHTVIAIVFVGSPADGYSRGLYHFSADILPTSIMTFQYMPGGVQCGIIPESYVIPLYNKYVMTCMQYNFGRYIFVRKLRRAGSLSLSEVEIHVQKLIFF